MRLGSELGVRAGCGVGWQRGGAGGRGRGRRVRGGALGAVGAGLVAAAATGQPCPPVIGPGHVDVPLSSGVSGRVTSAIVDTTTAPPSLVMSGLFTVLDSRGAAIRDFARWDGGAWSAVEGSPRGARSLAVYDDGSGAAVYAAKGEVLRFDGEAWMIVGSELEGAVAVHVLDRGRGAELFAAGDLHIGPIEAPAAVWNGDFWRPLGRTTAEIEGIGQLVTMGGVLYGVAEDGFDHPLARFDGVDWVIEPTVPDAIERVSVFDDGTGEAMYIGSRSAAGAGKYDGVTFEPVSELVTARDLLARAEPGGTFLYALLGTSEQATLRRFDGQTWEELGDIVGVWTDNRRLVDLAGFSTADALAVTGMVGMVGETPVRGIVEHSGGQWRPIGAGAPPVVFAQEHAGGISRLAIETVLPGADGVRHLTVDDGAGLRAVASLGPQVLSIDISTVGVGGELQTFVYGSSGLTSGGESYRGIARWTEAGIERLGDGLRGQVHDIEAFDDGSGPSLYAGGSFEYPRPSEGGGIARWTGSEWAPVGEGVDGWVMALAAFDDGGGSALYAGGRLSAAGGLPVDGFARWDGEMWGAVPGAPTGIISALDVVELRGQSILVVAGQLELPSGEQVVVMTWDGQEWTPLGHSYSRVGFSVGTAGSKYPFKTVTPIVRDDRLMVYLAGEGLSLSWAEREVSYSVLFDGERWHQIDPDGRIFSSAAAPDGGAITIGGEFATVNGVVQPGLAIITPCTCPADLDGDGELTFFDFLAFQNLFAAGDLRADFDEDGQLTFFDFLAFQNAFAAGCA